MTTPKNIIPLLDYTRLNQPDLDSAVAKFCQEAKTKLGNVAAVCVYPEYLSILRQLLAGTSIEKAVVINFPQGSLSNSEPMQTAEKAIEAGATELDWVMPYTDFFAGKQKAVEQHLQAARHLSGDIRLKIIIESGAFQDQQKLLDAALMCIDCGADFIKTSTGKIDIGATPEAIDTFIAAIQLRPHSKVGIKISGGVATTEDAQKYIQQICRKLGENWVHPDKIRIGASRLLNDLLKTTEGFQKLKKINESLQSQVSSDNLYYEPLKKENIKINKVNKC